MRLHVGVVLLTGASAVVLSVANAQTSTNQAQAAADGELAEVTITGSRVITDGADSPTPLTTVFEALLDRTLAH